MVDQEPLYAIYMKRFKLIQILAFWCMQIWISPLLTYLILSLGLFDAGEFRKSGQILQE
jgi:hypothetical protein